MDPPGTTRAERVAVQLRPDPSEVRLVERAIGVARVLLFTAALLMAHFVRPDPTGQVESLILIYAVAAIILLVAMELDELVRLDLRRPRNRQELLPLVAGVIRGTS